MKKILSLALAIVFISCQQSAEKKETTQEHKHPEPKTEAGTSKSPHTSTMETIGDAHIHIDYSSPRVRNRIIFGGLLPFDEVWQAGAHRATWIETSKDLIISDQVLPKGKYGFFVIPGKNEWTVIFNENWDQHGKDDYSEEDDVLRFKVTPDHVDTPQENLEYNIAKTGENQGRLTLSWEKVSISFPFSVK